MKFTTLPISRLEEYRKAGKGPINGTVHRVLRGLRNQAFVLTDKGEILGFIVRELPDSLENESYSTAPLAYPISRKTIGSWGSICELQYYRRTRAWFVSAELQGHLPLPVIPFSLENAS